MAGIPLQHTARELVVEVVLMGQRHHCLPGSNTHTPADSNIYSSSSASSCNCIHVWYSGRMFVRKRQTTR